jgi:hypothetical protein
MIKLIENLDLVRRSGAPIRDDDIEAGEIANVDLLGASARDLNVEIGRAWRRRLGRCCIWIGRCGADWLGRTRLERRWLLWRC